jgi:hypothetical protein
MRALTPLMFQVAIRMAPFCSPRLVEHREKICLCRGLLMWRGA